MLLMEVAPAWACLAPEGAVAGLVPPTVSAPGAAGPFLPERVLPFFVFLDLPFLGPNWSATLRCREFCGNGDYHGRQLKQNNTASLTNFALVPSMNFFLIFEMPLLRIK